METPHPQKKNTVETLTNGTEHISHSDMSPPYRLLVGHNKSDGSFKSDKQLRMEYIHRTANLIHEIVSGVEKTNFDTGEKYIEPYDKLVFLDKSARPLSWLTRDMWSEYATDDEGSVHNMPDMKYLNIDREQWTKIIDPLDIGANDVDRIDKDIIRSLRSIFIPPNDKQDGLSDAIDSTPAELDNTNILIIDEVRSTGRTLNIAKGLLSRAFPTADIHGTHWMGSMSTKSGGLALGNADLPVWYRSDSEYGRGVGNRAETAHNTENITQKLGHWFLSSRFPEPDQESAQLRKELRQLVRDPAVPKRPSLDHEDYIERVERLNKRPFKVAQEAIMATLAE